MARSPRVLPTREVQLPASPATRAERLTRRRTARMPRARSRPSGRARCTRTSGGTTPPISSAAVCRATSAPSGPMVSAASARTRVSCATSDRAYTLWNTLRYRGPRSSPALTPAASASTAREDRGEPVRCHGPSLPQTQDPPRPSSTGCFRDHSRRASHEWSRPAAYGCDSWRVSHERKQHVARAEFSREAGRRSRGCPDRTPGAGRRASAARPRASAAGSLQCRSPTAAGGTGHRA